jgi:chorismate-pyruvate lyase
MVAVVTPAELEGALCRESGTVTAFLERLVGEPVDALLRHQETTGADASSALRVAQGHPLLRRAAVLQGRLSGRPYLYAESVLVSSRLSAGFRQRLDSSDPIGRILEAEGVVVTRVPMSGPHRAGDRVSAPAGSPTDKFAGVSTADCLLTRSYRVDAHGTPIMVIDEWFLGSLGKFVLTGSAHGP